MSVTMSMDSGVINLPEGQKEAGQRVDFKPDKFVLAIETKGYRVAWSRAAQCPCTPINDQTEQPSPNCSLCDGRGWFYFAPALATVDEDTVGTLTDVQRAIVQSNAAVIRAIMTGITTEKVPYDPIGSRLEGVMNATVRPENRLGYYDRITNLDSLIVYSEVVEAGDPASPLSTRYPIVALNLVRSETTAYTAPTLSLSAGKIVWNDSLTAPASGTLLLVHYLCHPVWLVVNHPHAIRTSPVKFKTGSPVSPAGNPEPLPIQAVIKYEFLP